MNDKIYENQLNYVESILYNHPEFIEVIKNEEMALFDKYFRPN